MLRNSFEFLLSNPFSMIASSCFSSLKNGLLFFSGTSLFALPGEPLLTTSFIVLAGVPLLTVSILVDLLPCCCFKSLKKTLNTTNRYFDSIFGLANKINHFVYGGIYLKCILIEFVTPNLSQIYFSLKLNFEIWFWSQNHHFNLCSFVVNSQRLYCIPKTSVKFLF